MPGHPDRNVWLALAAACLREIDALGLGSHPGTDGVVVGYASGVRRVLRLAEVAGLNVMRPSFTRPLWVPVQLAALAALAALDTLAALA